MAKKQRKKGKTVKPVVPRVKDFLDMIAPAAVKFNTDSYVLGSSFRCTLALRSYPTTTEELALLCHLGEKSGVALHIYIRQATAGEEDAIIHNAQKPVMTIKAMAAGRCSPYVGLTFSWNAIRAQDMVTVGAFTPDEAEEDIEISLAAIEHRFPDLEKRGSPNQEQAAFGKG